jgi:hypothetical protein
VDATWTSTCQHQLQCVCPSTLCRHKQPNDTIREWHRLKQRQQKRISVCVKRAGRRSQRTNIVARQNKQGDKDEYSQGKNIRDKAQ